jgi:diguanylate cyclase (GGDEF)-like protein/PAS domain S-box-containing protein
LSGYLAGAYEGPVIAAILRAVAGAGGRVLAVQTSGTGRSYHQGVTLQRLAHVGWQAADGFVTIANAVPLTYLEELRAAGKPVVAIGNEEAGFQYPAVVSDNEGGVRGAVAHLVAHGHRRIAFVGCLDQFDIRERYEAYNAALAEHGIEADPALVFRSTNNFEHGAVGAVEAFLAAGMPATAVVAATDLNAVTFVRGLQAAGHRLPEAQAVVGFDNKPDCALMSPTLSSVAQDMEGIGALAAELVMAAVRGEEVRSGRHVVPTAYVARESCGCARGAGPVDGTRAADPVAEFLEAMRSAAYRQGTELATHAEASAREVEALFAAVAAREPVGRDLVRLTELCQALYADAPSREAHAALVELATALSSQVSAAGGADPGVAERLNQCSAQVALSLTKAQLDFRNNSYYELRKAIRDDYQITLDLLNNRDEDPRALRWMASTEARLAVLALWKGGAGRHGVAGRGGHDAPATLEVVGTFEAGGGRLELAKPVGEVECFPPEELFELGGTGLVCVFPVQSPTTDWGFLAIAEPVSARLDQEAHFTWSALFSEALDHRSLLGSLRRRGEDLALSYRREKEMAHAVRQSEERYALAAQAANDGLWDWDLSTGSIYYSSRWKEMLGYAEHQVGNDAAEWLGRVHPEDRPALLAQLELVKVGSSASFLSEHRVKASDGSYRWVLTRGLAVPGSGRPAVRVVGAVTDITERRQLEERLRQQALYDSLTGLANRVLFLDRLSQTMASAKRRPGLSYTVLWLDLDNFKQLNDTLGHLYGDRLLVQVAQRIRSQVRETDTAARFGGDEFVLLLENAEAAAVEGVVRRLSDSLNEPYHIDDETVVVTASIGIAMSTLGYERPEEILRDADTAMYQAKSTCRGSFVRYGAGPVANATR